jgi:transcriptional regulator with XRE-family HTH domain
MEELRQKILFLRNVKGLSFYQIEEQTGVSRKRISKIYQMSSAGDRKKRYSLLDKYHPLISNWFSEYPSLKAISLTKIAPSVLR